MIEIEVVQLGERTFKVILILVCAAMIAMYAYGWHVSAMTKELLHIPLS
jgi:hypothetical protein